MSTQALKLGLWLPQGTPNIGDNIVVLDPLGAYTTGFQPDAGAAAPAPGVGSRGTVVKLADLDENPTNGVPGYFDGVRTQFTLRRASDNSVITTARPEELLISVDGVLQAPDDDFTLAGYVITFRTAPIVGSTMFGGWLEPASTNPGNAALAAGGATLPAATRQGQVLVAGAGPSFDWAAGDADAGRY